jgi:hypothetical protein
MGADGVPLVERKECRMILSQDLTAWRRERQRQ